MSPKQFACSLEQMAGSFGLYHAPNSVPTVASMPHCLPPPIAPLDDRGLSPWGEVNPNKRTAQIQLESAANYVVLARKYHSLPGESLANLKQAAWYAIEAIFTLRAQLLPAHTFLKAQELRQKCLEIEPSAEPFLDELGWVYETQEEPEQVLPLAELRVERLRRFVAYLIEEA
jgi:hypothetical protein